MTIDALIQKIPIQEGNILKEAALQPVVFVEAARFRVEAMRKRAKAVAMAEYTDSKLTLAIRQSDKENGDKSTEKAIAARVEKHSAHRKTRDDMEDAYAEEEFSKLLLDAFRMRRDAIRIIAEARFAEGAPAMEELERIGRRKLSDEAHKLQKKFSNRRREPADD